MSGPSSPRSPAWCLRGTTAHRPEYPTATIGVPVTEFIEATDVWVSSTALHPVDPDKHESSCPHITPCSVAVHAEANAVAFAAKHGIATNGASLYTTVAPCLPCAQLVINAGIVSVMYLNGYRGRSGIDLLGSAGVAVSSWFATGSPEAIKL